MMRDETKRNDGSDLKGEGISCFRRRDFGMRISDFGLRNRQTGLQPRKQPEHTERRSRAESGAVGRLNKNALR